MADLADRLYWRVLIIRCQAGDHIAFEELVGHVHPRLRGFLHKMLSGSQHADDVAQDVWIDVYRDLPKLHNPEAFFPWLYRVARNRAYRLMRRRDLPVQSLTEIDIADLSEPDVEFTADEVSAVYTALDQLSPEHREVLLLRFIEDMSYEDIAAVIDCPVGTVRSRIHNAKILLRKVLESKDRS